MLGAASTKPMSAGIVAIAPSAGIVRYWACAPNRSSLNPNTRSPGSNPATPSPSDSTTPANSQPRIVTFGFDRPPKNRTIHGSAARKPQSVRFTVVAWTRTSTSPSPGTGEGTSTIRTTSGGPYLLRTAAFTALRSGPVRASPRAAR